MFNISSEVLSEFSVNRVYGFEGVFCCLRCIRYRLAISRYFYRDISKLSDRTRAQAQVHSETHKLRDRATNRPLDRAARCQRTHCDTDELGEEYGAGLKLTVHNEADHSGSRAIDNLSAGSLVETTRTAQFVLEPHHSSGRWTVMREHPLASI